MKLLHIRPSELLRNSFNPNQMTPEMESRLRESIRQLGFFRPVVAREVEGGYEILGGEHRAQIALRDGNDPIPVANLGIVDDVKAREIALADNSRYGHDDHDLLANMLKELTDAGEDITNFLPYTDADLLALFAHEIAALEDLEFDLTKTAAPPEPAPRKTAEFKVLRLKVPVGDVDLIDDVLSEIQAIHGYTEGDSLTNAGDALLFLARNYRGMP